MCHTERDLELHHRIQRMMLERINTPLISNTYRGDYIEFLVSTALEPEWSLTSATGDDWAAWDLEHPSGSRLEVKNSAARQSWDQSGQNPKRRPTFDIGPREGYWLSSNGKWTKVHAPGRQADVYVFAWHDEIREDVADHRVASQWQFFVVNENTLPPIQKSISLNRLADLANPCRFEDLRTEVERCLPPPNELKAALRQRS